MVKKGVEILNQNGRKVAVGLGYYDIEEISGFKELLKKSIERYNNKPAFRFKKNNTIFEKSYIEFGSDINALGTALISLGLKNKRIAIIGENRYEWALSFFSVVNGTGIAVPLDKHLPEIEIENLIKRGKVDAIFYSKHFENEMLKLSKENNGIECYICMEESDNSGSAFSSIPSLINLGKKLISQGDRTFTDARINPDELSVLLFTSGTTSISKGVMLSQRNICSDVSAVTSIIKIYPTDVHLSILPLHHTFELSAGMVLMIKNGVCIAYCEGVKHIAKNLREFKVTVLVVVPAILEAIYKKVNEGIKKSGKEGTVKALGRVSKALQKVGIDVRRKLFKKILEQVGPYLRLAVSGAAPIDKDIVSGFDMLGLKVIQGYGLTETSPVLAANNDFYNKAGTIGQPMKGIKLAIDKPDENGMGEILAKGPNLMLGYYEDANATNEAIDKEGWFHTGDLGHIDDDGFITITGRAKSMIVLTNGKKAFPEEYEMLLNNIDGVKESYVWGNKAPDGDIQVCAKLVLNDAVLKERFDTVQEEGLASYFQKEIKNINQNIPQYKMIRYFIMSHGELVKTTTLKIKRPVEYEKITSFLEKESSNMRKYNGRLVD